MGFSSKYYEQAINDIKATAKRREQEYDYKLRELYKEIPELSLIDTQLQKLGAASVSAAFVGDTEKVKEIKKQSGELTAAKKEILKSAKLRTPSPVCKLCSDTGYCGTKLCECVKARAKQLVYEELREQMPLDKATFDTFSLDYYEGNAKKVMSNIFKKVRLYAEGFSKNSGNLLFMGGVGLGKTHLSLAIINAVTERGYGVVYASAQNLFTSLEREHFSYSGETEKRDAVLDCDLLVIDDLGTEFLTPFISSQLHNIIETRINRQKATIINTNLTLPEIEKKYTARVLSRLIGNYTVHIFEGNDIRTIKAFGK